MAKLIAPVHILEHQGTAHWTWSTYTISQRELATGKSFLHAPSTRHCIVGIFTSFRHSPSRITTFYSVSSLHCSPFCCTSTALRMKQPVRLLAFSFCLCACFLDRRGSAQRLSVSERAALVVLRGSLHVRSRYWSIRADPCSNWSGVGCVNGVVQSLDLTKLRPRRQRAKERAPRLDTNALHNLTHLASLNASDFPLSGPVPAALGSVASLVFLSLARTGASGSIPPALGNLSRLEFLDLSGNSLNGTIPVGLAAISKLETLNLSNNCLSGSVPSALGGLSSLKSLDLSFNSLDGVLPNFSGHSLSSIKLDHNHFSSNIPNSLWKLQNLVVLDVSNNNLTGVLEISDATGNRLVKGVSLNLSHNLFYGSLPSQLSTIMERFRVVDLSSNYFEGIGSRGNISASMNCFSNLGNQRPQIDCDNFYIEKGLAIITASTSKRSWHWWYTLVAVVCGLAFIALLVPALMLCAIRYRARCASRKVTGGDPAVVPTEEAASQTSVAITVSPPAFDDGFSYEQLVKATSGFCSVNLIKNGHSGDLYHGVLEDGVEVVVKKIDLEATRREAFLTELNLFETLSGARLVPFLGRCLENEKEKLFVYNYMSNGDLNRALRKKSRREDGSLQSLDWIKRLKIASGIAEALCFLHHECDTPLVHRDVEASSILLDDKYEVRLGSLGEVCVQQFDVHENFLTRMLRPQASGRRVFSGCSTATCAYDIYCMGKVLLELVTGKLGISGSNNAETNKWVEQTVACINIYDKGLVCGIVDPSLVVDEDHMAEVWAVAVIAKCCLDPKPSRRPLARHVLQALQSPLKVVNEVNYPSISSSRGSWQNVLFGGWITSFVSVRSAGEDKSMSTNTRPHSAEQVRPSSTLEGVKRDCPVSAMEGI